jgi:hypothetical protein
MSIETPVESVGGDSELSSSKYRVWLFQGCSQFLDAELAFRTWEYHYLPIGSWVRFSLFHYRSRGEMI